jgi:hypothetical protein
MEFLILLNHFTPDDLHQLCSYSGRRKRSCLLLSFLQMSRKDRGLQLELLLEYLDKKRPRRITIPTSDGLQFIDLENIIYLEQVTITPMFTPDPTEIFGDPNIKRLRADTSLPKLFCIFIILRSLTEFYRKIYKRRRRAGYDAQWSYF